MNISKNFLNLFIITLILVGFAYAETIIWVADDRKDPFGEDCDFLFVDVLEGAGYDVQRENGTMSGIPLTTEQLDILESGDLVIVSRSTNSGDYNDPLGWNSVTKPLILFTVYLSRDSRWKWFPVSDLIDDGGCPLYHVEMPEHPIFAGITPDADGNVMALDSTIASGNTSLANWNEVGDEGEIIATSVHPATVENAVAIAYWPQDALFHPDGDQFAGNSRLLFTCATRELSGQTDWGYNNLTEVGEIMFLNAVAWMLGKEVGVKDNPATTPTEYDLAQNFPNPFNPSTTIEFSIPTQTVVKLSVYNMLGQEVARLVDQSYQAGSHQVTWDGRDMLNNQVESGVYLYRLETEEFSISKKMVLMK